MPRNKMDLCHIFLFNLLIPTPVAGTETSAGCPSPQYLELGRNSVVNCTFKETFYAVVWYDSDAYFTGNLSFIQLINGIKTGDGYSSGEFDIFSNGSLIIRNTTLRNDQNLTVIIYPTDAGTPLIIHVKVVVKIKPSTTFPIVNLNGQVNNTWFTILKRGFEVTCLIKNARPAISLQWVQRTVHGDRKISYKTSVMEEDLTFTTRVTTSDAFSYSSYLSLLLCKAESVPGMLLKNEAILFTENSDIDLSTVDPIKRIVEQGSRLEISCSTQNASLIVWKMADDHNDIFQVLSYAALFDKSISKTYSDEFQLKNDGSLVFPQIKAKHEGLYGCTFENDNTGVSKVFDIVVFVLAYPVVKGCTIHQFCVLEAQQLKGNLTCSLTGIRPRVQLEWNIIHKKDSSSIRFTDHRVTVNNNHDVYNISLTSTYYLQDVEDNKLTLECRVAGTDINNLKLSAKFDLLVTDVQPTKEAKVSVNSSALWLLFFIPLYLFDFFAVARFFFQRGRTKTDYQTAFSLRLEEEEPELLKRFSLEVKQNMFISQLKEKYRDLYEAVQPLPYIRGRLYCVDRVFVEGGIEYLVSTGNIEGHGTWAKLDTYQDILNDSRVKSFRRILEGEPGYGKSTLAFQIAYDWCNEIPASNLKNTHILLLLQLRQLGGVTSIFRAIKLFLLPIDSQLSEEDVRKIICKSSSVLVVLDGFDEYPDKDSDTNTDVISIITREIFQQSEVILTTRSSYLPKKYPALTKRLKLTGFDDTARDQYIRKAVVGDDANAAEEIKRKLQQNPVLSDLCQVPLFFAMFAHMSHESKHFQNFNTVTLFFKYIISCFHSHMKNKMKAEKVKKFYVYEQEHKELDKLAFEGLSGKNPKIVWRKEDLCKRLGQDFYDQYVRIGVLVEEEVLDLSENIQYKTEVRFYHKLFCEWYAAHYLSEYASRKELIVKPQKETILFHATEERQEDDFLRYLDPIDVQYIYRFACGLNPKASENIIAYLTSREDAEKFVLLCILEQGGKGDRILHYVENLCSQLVEINTDDSLLLQRCTMQLLEIASTSKISISEVRLYNCLSTVDRSGRNNLLLKANLSISVLTTLNKLTIREIGREITAEELTGILQYSSKCPALTELWFRNCQLPISVQAESVSVLRSKDIKVMWVIYGWYRLDLTHGHWVSDVEYGGDDSVMTD